MKKYIELLKWLAENKEAIDKLLKTNKVSSNKKEEIRYSLAGVPKNQLKDIDDILKNDEVK